MFIIMDQYVSFITVWCLVLNTYIFFSSGSVKELEKKEKRMMERVIYFIIVAMMVCNLSTYIFAGNNAEWVYWCLKFAQYSVYLLKYLYLTAFIIFIMEERNRPIKKGLLSISVLIGMAGMVCILLTDIIEKSCGYEQYYVYYIRLYDMLRGLLVLDLLVLLSALFLEKEKYRKKTFYLYLGYVFVLFFTAIMDYFTDTWYLQNLSFFFSSMIIFIDNMTQVSDQWLNAKKELLITEYKASHDIMTGLWNKASGLAKIRECMEDMQESDMAVLGFADIDNFKSVNDIYGHENGDFWICEIASALHEMCGSSDIACRYGGDEYIFFLKNTGSMDELTARIDSFRKKVHDKAAEREQDVHCSIGLYQVKESGEDLSECIMKADGLLYQAKKNGKDTYIIG